MKTVLVYGSTLGNCKIGADLIAKTLGDTELHEVSRFTFGKLPEADLFIFGGSTWGSGDLQDDWDLKIESLRSANLTGKKVALFGTGDQVGYSDTFCDAVGELYDAVTAAGAEVVGTWSTDDYQFTDSKAVRNGRFVGLILDEDNQYDLTNVRIAKWCSQISKEIE